MSSNFGSIPNLPAPGVLDAVPVICSFPLSGQYGVGARFLFYHLIFFCILGARFEWARSLALVPALLYPAVAAVHGIVLTAAAPNSAVVDLDMFGIFQICAIAVICEPFIMLYSSTYFHAKGRNLIFLLTALNLIGLLSLSISFNRAIMEPCLDSSSNNVTSTAFWPLHSSSPQTVCSTTQFPSTSGGCDIKTLIRSDPSNPSQWVPVPLQGLTFPVVRSMALICSLAAIMEISHIHTKMGHMRFLAYAKKWLRARRLSVVESLAAEHPALLLRPFRRWLRSFRMRTLFIYRYLGQAATVSLVLMIIVLGEINFWSLPMRNGVEPWSAVGQWGGIVATLLTVSGFVALDMMERWNPDVKESEPSESTMARGQEVEESLPSPSLEPPSPSSPSPRPSRWSSSSLSKYPPYFSPSPSPSSPSSPASPSSFVFYDEPTNMTGPGPRMRHPIRIPRALRSSIHWRRTSADTMLDFLVDVPSPRKRERERGADMTQRRESLG